MKKNQQHKTFSRYLLNPKTSILILGLTYAFFVIVRYLLACRFLPYPTVMIDERLYYSMARSIGTGEGLSVFGQPADYSFYLYSLVLSPIYALFPDGSNFYRILQLWNCCIINLSIFPLFCLGKKITTPAKSYGLGVMALFTADFTTSSLIMTENLLYPLFFLLMLLIYRTIVEDKRELAVWIGILGGLMFSIKPGAIVTAAVALGFLLYTACQAKNKPIIVSSVKGLAAMLFTAGFFFAILYLIFRQNTTPLSIYDEQVGASTAANQVYGFFCGLFQTPYYFLICGGIFAVAIPICRIHSYAPKHQQYMMIIVLSVIVSVIGIAWIINRVETTDMRNTIHTRYVAMFIPIFIMMCFLPTDDNEVLTKKNGGVGKQSIMIGGISLYLILVTLLKGSFCGTSASNAGASQFAVSFLRPEMVDKEKELLINILICMLAILLPLLLLKLKGNVLRRFAIGILIPLFLFGNIGAYTAIAGNPNRPQEAQHILDAIGDENFFYVYSNRSTWLDALLDVNSKKAVIRTSLEDLYNHLKETKGIYSPFVPAQVRGTKPENPTPDTDIIVMDRDAFRFIEFSDDVEILTSDRTTVVIRIKQGEPMARSMMANVMGGTLNAGQNALVTVYNQSQKADSVTLDIELPQEAECTFTHHDHSFNFTLPAGRSEYEISRLDGAEWFTFSFQECDVKVYSYTITFSE